MPKITLCFGRTVYARELAKAIDVGFGEVDFKKCRECEAKSPRKNNFCGNCGKALRINVVDIGATEVAMLAEKKIPLPRGIVLVPVGEDIVIGQVLDKSTFGPARFSKPLASHPWEELNREALSYIGNLGISSEEPEIIAFTEVC